MGTRNRTACDPVQRIAVAPWAAAHAPAFENVTPVAGGLLIAHDTVTGRDRLVYGSGPLAHAARRGDTHINAIVLPADQLPDEAIERLETLDASRTKDLSWMADGALLFRSLPMGLETVSTLLGLSGRADAHRMVRFGERPRDHRRAATAAGVTRGHLRYLTTLADNAFVERVAQIKTGAWSVRDLQKKTLATSAEVMSYAGRLGEALGTEVTIHWPENPAFRSVEIAWYHSGDLLGILERLVKEATAAGTSSHPLPSNARRCLTLALRSPDELEAVFGSLGSES